MSTHLAVECEVMHERNTLACLMTRSILICLEATTGSPVIIVDSVELEGEGSPPQIDPEEDDDGNSAPPRVEIAVPNLPPPAEPMIRTPCTRLPTRYIRDIQAGKGTANQNIPRAVFVARPARREDSPARQRAGHPARRAFERSVPSTLRPRTQPYHPW
jgi:hypothetical protein